MAGSAKKIDTARTADSPLKIDNSGASDSAQRIDSTGKVDGAKKLVTIGKTKTLSEAKTSIDESRKVITDEEIKQSSNSSNVEIPSLKTVSNDGKNGKKVIWADLTVSVPLQANKNTLAQFRSNEEGRKVILNQVSGYACPGEVLAVMGGSGAGKTVLLNALTGIDQTGIFVSGSVTVNGRPTTGPEMREISAYVQQADLFIGTLTVREQLNFSAALRMGNHISREARDARVEEVLKDLGLRRCENTLIGVPNRVKGISCGESKRLAFACEILTDPAILFCDEPTSGLDSFMAAQVISSLKDLSKKCKSIMITIHQPSTQVFNMFDNVCFMADGEVAYFGPANKVCDFWKDIGLECPPTYNPADHVIRTLSISETAQGKSYDQIRTIRTKFEESTYGMDLYRKTHMKESKHQAKESIQTVVRTAGWFKQLKVLFARSFLTTVRDPLLLKVKFIQVIATSLVIAIVNLRTEVTGPTVMNIEGILYNTVRDMNFMFLFPSITVITSELPIFLREYKAGIYKADTYYLSKSLAEAPQYTLLPIIYSLIVYFLSGLYGSFRAFAVYTFVVVVLTHVAISIAYAGACVFAEDSLALTYMPCFILPMLVFGGFYISFHSIPHYFKWLSLLSWFRYGFEALQINQWLNYAFIPGCQNGTIPTDPDHYCPARDGRGLLTRRGMGTNTTSEFINVLVLIAMLWVFRGIGLFSLLIRARFTK